MSNIYDKSKVVGYLGIASKARYVISGESDVIKGIQKGQVKIVLLATDIGSNASKKIHDKCYFYKITLFDKLDSETISNAIGKMNRKVVGITDEGIKNEIIKYI